MELQKRGADLKGENLSRNKKGRVKGLSSQPP